MPTVKPQKTPEITSGVRIRAYTPHGHLHMTVVVDLKENRELEIFAQIGKSAEMVSSEMEGLCRLASLYLRVNGSLDAIIKQLLGIGSMITLRDDLKSQSVPDSLARALFAYREYRKKFGLRAMILGEVTTNGDLDVSLIDTAKPESVFTAIRKEEPAPAPAPEPEAPPAEPEPPEIPSALEPPPAAGAK